MSINLINYALAKKDWEKAYEDLKILEIGGRNLLKNGRLIRPFSNNPSNFPISYTLMTEGERQFYRIVRTNTQSHPTTMSIYNNIPVTDITQDLLDQTVTFSFRARASHNVNSNLMFAFTGGSNNRKDMNYHASTFQITTSWKIFAFTVDIDFSIYNSDFLRFTPWQITIPSGEIDNFYLDLCEFKIELGNRATDWTPAPEDINAHPFVTELAETMFRSKQTDWEKAYEDLKVLGVGGRNLIRDTSDKNKTVSWSGWDYRLVDVTNIEDIGLSVGDTIVFRVYIEETNMPVRAFVEFYVLDDEGKIDYRPKNGNIIYEGESGWSEVKLTISEEDVKNLVQFKVAIRNTNNSDATVTYRKAKLEIGNEATDWTPAPEDINAHPFVAELAENMFRSKQNEERIRNLENAIVALGGGS